MLKTLALLMTAALLSGCASMNRLSSEVSTYGNWPAGQANSTFTFDRLPSHGEDQQQALESAALPALTAAGFRKLDRAADAGYIVQVGASVTAAPRWIDDHPFHPSFGWYGAWRPRHFGIGLGWGWGWGRHGSSLASTTYLREVVVLIRDRRSGQTVYETRASNSGYSPSINSLLPAMFGAALADFPHRGPNPRHVVMPIAD